MANILTAKQIKKLDSVTINKHGVPSLILMERAGRGIAGSVERYKAFLASKKTPAKVAIFCGRGNNGGDGLVSARYLAGVGVDVKVFLLSKESYLSNDAKINLLVLKKLKVPITIIDSSALFLKIEKRFNANIIVDAIFGTGFKGEPKGLFNEVIEFLNKQCAHLIAVDTPSGLDVTTGVAKGAAIIADETITIHAEKTGFFKNDGLTYCGRVKVIDIGLIQ